MSAILLECCDVAAKVIKCGCDVDVTNNYDLGITGTICQALICITTIIVGGFLVWKLMEYIAKRNYDIRKRRWDKEDKDLKQKSDLIDKKLHILSETCYDLSKDEPKKVVKKYDDGAVKNYIAALNDALETKSSSKPEADE